MSRGCRPSGLSHDRAEGSGSDPIVANGVMYISQYNRIDAIDARSGNIIWQYQRQPVATGAQRGTGFGTTSCL